MAEGECLRSTAQRLKAARGRLRGISTLFLSSVSGPQRDREGNNCTRPTHTPLRNVSMKRSALKSRLYRIPD